MPSFSDISDCLNNGTERVDHFADAHLVQRRSALTLLSSAITMHLQNQEPQAVQNLIIGLANSFPKLSQRDQYKILKKLVTHGLSNLLLDALKNNVLLDSTQLDILTLECESYAKIILENECDADLDICPSNSIRFAQETEVDSPLSATVAVMKPHKSS